MRDGEKVNIQTDRSFGFRTALMFKNSNFLWPSLHNWIECWWLWGTAIWRQQAFLYINSLPASIFPTIFVASLLCSFTFTLSFSLSLSALFVVVLYAHIKFVSWVSKAGNMRESCDCVCVDDVCATWRRAKISKRREKKNTVLIENQNILSSKVNCLGYQ